MKKTIKRRLVEHMLANGNSFRYTDMIKWIVENTTSESNKYDWKKDRGYYATNFDKRSNGYMINGSGDCMVYKCKETGKWKAKLLSKQDQMEYKISKSLTNFKHSAIANEANRRYMIEKMPERAGTSAAWDKIHQINTMYSDLTKQEQTRTTKKILKAYNTLK